MNTQIIADVRKLTQTAGTTYYVTIPRAMIKQLGWKKGQKMTVRLEGERVVIEDWKGT